jgi:GNAT superfamily N-acetyltransferase
MAEEIELVNGGAELIPAVESLWEALFDHHLEVSRSGVATIARELSWPRRRAHYERLFSSHAHAEIWLARNAGGPVAYALWHEDEIDGRRAAVLESLSVLAAARGLGLGTRLMQTVDARARSQGIELSAVDVLSGNDRAMQLYRRYGFEPHAEFWLRSNQHAAPRPESSATAAELAGTLGLELSIDPGPDDTWISSARMASLTAVAERERDPQLLESLFARLEGDGAWTIFVYIPAPPKARPLREELANQGFRRSMERLTRVI